VNEPVFDLLPDTSSPDAPFWTAGADGNLHVLRCQACGHWIHPPTIACPICLSRDVAFEATSGKGTLFSYAISHQPAGPEVEIPYLIALVELAEQPGLRITTTLVNCELADAKMDMPLKVAFREREDVFIPVFEPDLG
jgi:uncharacterized protein